MKLTFLGTGTSFGVPQIGCRCAVCHSSDARDKRTRCGAVVETDDGTRLLIDTPPELRLQVVACGIDRVDAVLFTHDHADHIHGVDDIRAFSVRRSTPLPMYGPADTLARLATRFPYIFDDRMKPLPGTSKPEGHAIALVDGERVAIGDAVVEAIAVPHGLVTVFGYRVGPIAYVTDAKSIPAAALERLRGVKVLVLNALFRTEHPTHLSLAQAIDVAREVGAPRTYLTHLTHQNFHADLEAELPPGIAPAFDGLVIHAGS
ncbi:MAG: MBL fold metallo-hydrolase [Cytophagaceae bacterium]|nr:MBL fold metallo-hydrolase [Gemmatimonadaceae bacterium]